jgi:hypothetical protein
MAAFFDPDQSIADLRSVAVGDNNLVTLSEQLDHAAQTLSCIFKLLGDIALFELPADGIPAQGYDNSPLHSFLLIIFMI